MPEKDRISNPSMGSEELGKTEPETRGSGVYAGTNTQTQMAALSAQLKKEKDQAISNAKNNAEEINGKDEQDGTGII